MRRFGDIPGKHFAVDKGHFSGAARRRRLCRAVTARIAKRVLSVSVDAVVMWLLTIVVSTIAQLLAQLLEH